MRQNWPKRLWLVRHGQSQGNVARDRAHAAGHSVIDLDVRDVDVPLSDLGERQAIAAGQWFAKLPSDERPEVILSSPYLRARQTATAICEAGALSGEKAKSIIDERLREREFGVFDGLTTRGIRENFPRKPPTAPRWANSTTARRAARAGPTSSCACGACSTRSTCSTRPPGRHRLPPGRGAVHALHFGGAG